MDKISCNNLVKNFSAKDYGILLKGQNGSIASADIAPVHSSGSKQVNKVQKMEADNKLITRPPALESDIDSISNSLSNNMKEKLSLNTKSTKNINKNGIRFGTTEVEVHCGPSNEINIPASVRSKSSDLDRPLWLTDSQTQICNISSQEKVSKISSPPSPIKPPFNYNSDSNSKPELAGSSSSNTNGAICNGHTISEATSSNSITVSDFSLSSEKSNSVDSSYSYSGARPRKRNTSNSSSQSMQPNNHYEINQDIYSSTTSESSCKLLEENNEILSSPPDNLFIATNSKRETVYMPSLNIKYINYENENQMEAIMRLIQKDLSEPYSIYTYRYFIHNWPKLCFLATHNEEIIGAIVCKLDVHKKVTARGYIAMLAVDQRYRKKRIGSNLVQRAIRAMITDDADEVVLETEITNKPALQLYENLGFVRDKRLFRYYLNGVDALRLKLWLR